MERLGLVPVLVLCTLVLVYHNELDYRGLSLVLTNSFGCAPFWVCIQNRLYSDSIPFFCIILTSGSYHLCDALDYEFDYCRLPQRSYVVLDFINAYACVGVVIVRLLDTGWSSQIHAFNIVLYTVMVCLMNRLVPLCYTSIMAIVLLIKIVVERENYYRIVKTPSFIIGFCLALISFTVYIATVYYGIDERNYWALHAFGWHVPVLVSSALILNSLPKQTRVQEFNVQNETV
jgi:hypothetical protein